MILFDSNWFSKCIKQLRESDGCSLRELSDQTGISASTISRVENGEEPSLNTFIVLSERFSMSNLALDMFITED